MIQGESYRLKQKKKAGILGHSRFLEADRGRAAKV
jgi:hypothetical protein